MGSHSKKYPFRKITVNDVVYRWKVTGEDDFIDVVLAPNSKKGQIANGGFSYFSIFIEHFDREGRVKRWSMAQRLVITPYHIRQSILKALEMGWIPESSEPALQLGNLNTAMDLRLKPDLVFPKLAEGEVVLSFAELDSGAPLKPDYTPFKGWGKFYHTFPSQEAAISFAKEKVLEHPEVECWIRREKNVADYYVSASREFACRHSAK